MKQESVQSAHHLGGLPYFVGQPIMIDPHTQGLQQQGIVVIQAQQTVNDAFFYSNYKKKASIALGTLQIIMALLLVGLNTAMAIVDQNGWFFATGWWAAPIYVLAGSFGIAAGCHPSGCTVITTMVMSIISCITVFFAAGQSGISLYYGSCYPYEKYSSTSICLLTENLVLGSFFTIFWICEFFFAVVQSAHGCEACCRRPVQNQMSQLSQVVVCGNGGSDTHFMLAPIQSQNGASQSYTTPPGGATRPILKVATVGAQSGKPKRSHATDKTKDIKKTKKQDTA